LKSFNEFIHTYSLLFVIHFLAHSLAYSSILLLVLDFDDDNDDKGPTW